MDNKQIQISAVIIAKNEEKMLEGCLATLSFADEIVVIDTGSTDKTVQIAKKAKARVVSYVTGKNFSDWRNKGKSEARGTWIFYIDADERVSAKLKKEILDTVNGNETDSWYVIPRSNKIFGKEFRHGGWWPDYVKRLYKKEALTKWTGILHEEPVTTGTMGYLKNPLTHIKHETVFEMMEKTNQWSDYEAKLMFEANHPPMTVLRFFSAMGREFWYRMVIKLGFLDGRQGVSMAMYQVYSRFVSYAKLWELQQKHK
jgi:glycosyltransferase involved in cell wall biosynthesis